MVANFLKAMIIKIWHACIILILLQNTILVMANVNNNPTKIYGQYIDSVVILTGLPVAEIF